MSAFSGFHFGMPWAAAAAPLVLIAFWRFGREARVRSFLFSSIGPLESVARPFYATVAWRRTLVRAVILALLLLALAQPQVDWGAKPETAEAIDVLLLVDASRSMDTKDFEGRNGTITRLEALRAVVAEFVKARPQDRLGVVAFAERPFLVCPLTLDHSWMLESLGGIETSLGTAIGSSIDAGVALLRAGGNPSQVLILITDGINTSGSDPLKAAELAANAGVRLYTVEAVSFEGLRTSGFDEHPLYLMAKRTGGRFFQAGNADSLGEIYREIDQIERQEIRRPSARRAEPLYPWIVGVVCVLLGLEMLLSSTRWLRIP